MLLSIVWWRCLLLCVGTSFFGSDAPWPETTDRTAMCVCRKTKWILKKQQQQQEWPGRCEFKPHTSSTKHLSHSRGTWNIIIWSWEDFFFQWLRLETKDHGLDKRDMCTTNAGLEGASTTSGHWTRLFSIPSYQVHFQALRYPPMVPTIHYLLVRRRTNEIRNIYIYIMYCIMHCIWYADWLVIISSLDGKADN